jgi:hypothetical protein
MRDYQPSNLIAPQGILFLIVAAVVGGVAIGLLTYFVSTLIYLIIVFPLLIGAAAGGVIAGAVIIGKVRSPIGAAIFGILIAVILYGTYRYAEYEIGFKNDTHDAYIDILREEIPAGVTISDEELEETLDSFLGDDTAADFELKDIVGSTGFGAFVEYSADAGVTFNRSRSTSGSGFTISGTGAYIYWLIEFAVIAVIAAVVAHTRAKAPFSEETKEWYGKDEYVGTLSPNGAREFFDNLKQNNLATAGQHLSVSSTQPPRIDVAVKKVTSPTADVVLVVKKLTPKGNGRTDTDVVQRGMLTPSEFSQLQSSMPRAEQPTM